MNNLNRLKHLLNGVMKNKNYNKESEKLFKSKANKVRKRFAKGFLDVLVLALIQKEPNWGYKIIRQIEELYEFKVRHGALYPLLNSLEVKGFLISKYEVQGRRMRRVYEITPEGTQLVNSYYEILKEQINRLEIRGG